MHSSRGQVMLTPGDGWEANYEPPRHVPSSTGQSINLVLSSY